VEHAQFAAASATRTHFSVDGDARLRFDDRSLARFHGEAGVVQV